MVVGVDQKARILDLVTGVLELTLAGERNAVQVADILQIIKGKQDFHNLLLHKPEKSWRSYADIEDVEFSPIEPSKLELVSFLVEGETWIETEEVLRRARSELKANLGLRHAEYLLKHRKEIPIEFQPYVLLFPGTILRYSDSQQDIPVLIFERGEWGLSFMYLIGMWDDEERLVRLQKE